MTLPTITNRHGFCDDCNDDTDWQNETVSGMTAEQAVLTVVDDEFFQIAAICDGSGDEYVYYEKDITDVSSTYTNALIRWKTSAVASPGLGANVEAVYTDASTQLLLGSVPQFSGTFTNTLATLTYPSGESLDKLRIYGNDYPDTFAPGTSANVWFDFILICRDIFTIPVVMPGGVSLKYPKKVPRIEIPGRDGDIIQVLGMKSPEITLRGDMMSGESWGTPFGEVFYYIVRDSDPWQWFTSDITNCKVVVAPEGCELGQESDSGAQRTWTLKFLQYSLASLGISRLDGKQWFGK